MVEWLIDRSIKPNNALHWPNNPSMSSRIVRTAQIKWLAKRSKYLRQMFKDRKCSINLSRFTKGIQSSLILQRLFRYFKLANLPGFENKRGKQPRSCLFSLICSLIVCICLVSGPCELRLAKETQPQVSQGTCPRITIARACKTREISEFEIAK